MSRYLPRGSTPWSRVRRLFTYVVAALLTFLIVEATAAQAGVPLIRLAFVAWTLAGLAALYFLTVVVGVIFLSSSEFRPKPSRLAVDTVVSILFSIMAFSVLYRFLGISLAETCSQNAGKADPADHVYFSAVTFSTLGYGDFRPCEPARLVAAFHAIFGNLHLGLIVGCAFFFAQKDR